MHRRQYECISSQAGESVVGGGEEREREREGEEREERERSSSSRWRPSTLSSGRRETRDSRHSLRRPHNESESSVQRGDGDVQLQQLPRAPRYNGTTSRRRLRCLVSQNNAGVACEDCWAGCGGDAKPVANPRDGSNPQPSGLNPRDRTRCAETPARAGLARYAARRGQP